MRKRSTIWLMLTVAALQGTGLLHTFHLAAEHALPHSHNCAAGHCCNHGGGGSTVPDRGLLYNSQNSHHGHEPCHDPATCSVCQMLASLWAVSTAPIANLATKLPVTGQVAVSGSFALSRIALSTLGPRAPPMC